MNATFAIVYANLKGNLGDFAILHSILAEIDATWPQSRKDVYSQPFVNIDNARFDAFAREAPHFTYKGPLPGALKPLNPTLIKVLRSIGCLPHYQAFRTRAFAVQAQKAMRADFSGYNAIYAVGGAQWTGIDAGVSMFGNLRALAVSGTPIHAFPFSVSSAIRKVNRQKFLRADLSLIAPPLIVRDSHSQTLLNKIGVKSVLGADCVFGVPKIALGPRAARERSVLFVVTGQSNQDLREALVQTVEAGFEPRVLTTCLIEDGEDQKKVCEELLVPFLAPMTWQEAVHEMAASELIVTNRLHGLILASLAQSAVIPLIDRSKVRAVAEDAMMSIRLEDLSEFGSLALVAASKQRAELIRKLQEYADKAHQGLWSPISRFDD